MAARRKPGRPRKKPEPIIEEVELVPEETVKPVPKKDHEAVKDYRPDKPNTWWWLPGAGR